MSGIARVLGPDGEPVEVVVAAPPHSNWIRGEKIFDADALRAEMEVYDPPSEKEVAEAAMRIAQEEHDEAARQKVAASTIVNVTNALAALLVSAGYGLDGETILIPRSVVDAWEGSKLGIRRTADGDLILRFRPRAALPLEPEEMRRI